MAITMRGTGRAMLCVAALVAGLVPAIATAPVMAATAALPYDFNGDGYADLAIGAPGEDLGSVNAAGAVNVIPGTASGPTAAGDQIWHQNRKGIKGGAEANDGFGWVVASADFDADGFADLAIGAPGEGLSGHAFVGAVHVLYGSRSGLTAAGDQLWHQGRRGVPGANEYGDLFGQALAAGDFDADGFADLAIGVPGESVGDMGGGGLIVLRGSAEGLTTAGARFWSQASEGIPDDPQASPSDLFGQALASGDFDADGFSDLAVAAPREDASPTNGAGAVHVMFGGRGGLSAARTQFLLGRDLGIDTPRGEGGLGLTLASADFDADGRDDLAVGDPDPSGYREGGAVAVLLAGAAGFDPATVQWWYLDRADLPGTGVYYDWFGRSLAAGDVTQDGFADLLIGSHGLGVFGGTHAEEDETLRPGAVHLLVGSGSGLSATSTVLGKDDEWAAPGDDRGPDFGSSLVVLGGGAPRLVIGTRLDDVYPAMDAGSVTVYPLSTSGPVAASASVWHQGTPGIKGSPEYMDMLGSVSGATWG